MHPCLFKKYLMCFLTPQVLWQPIPDTVEENGPLTVNSWEFSSGNGSVNGGIRLFQDYKYRLVGLTIHVDSINTNSSAEVGMYDIKAGNSNALAVFLASISINSATDGGGQPGNGHKSVTFDPPISVPSDAVISFKTISTSGTMTDARVTYWLECDNGQTTFTI